MLRRRVPVYLLMELIRSPGHCVLRTFTDVTTMSNKVRTKKSAMFGWTDDRVEKLKTLHDRGCSASTIAAALSHKDGESVSRSAVIGKIHRLGLSGARVDHYNRRGARDTSLPIAATKVIDRGTRLRKKIKPPVATLRNLAAEMKTALKAEPLPPSDAAIGGIDLLELEPHHCRWPLGEGPFKFCGAQKVEGKPYCSFHCARAYTPLYGRKRMAMAA